MIKIAPNVKFKIYDRLVDKEIILKELHYPTNIIEYSNTDKYAILEGTYGLIINNCDKEFKEADLSSVKRIYDTRNIVNKSLLKTEQLYFGIGV